MTTYSTIVRAKGIFDECTTLAEMIAASEAQTALLKEMAEAGIELWNDEVMDDYATVVTSNKAVAKRFGMHRMQ